MAAMPEIAGREVMIETTKTTFRPYHETIVDLIQWSSTPNGLVNHICTTAIPKGHDEVIAVINQRWGSLKEWASEVAAMKASVLSQKELAEERERQKAKIKTEEVTFGELQVGDEILVANGTRWMLAEGVPGYSKIAVGLDKELRGRTTLEFCLLDPPHKVRRIVQKG